MTDQPSHAPDAASIDADASRMRELLVGMQAVLNQIGAYIYTKDTDGRYLFVNEQVRQVFGLPYEQIIGRDDSHFFDFAKSDELRMNDRRVMTEGRTLEQEERNIHAATGEERIYWTVKSPVRNEAGQIVGLCGISTDITARKRMEEELAYASTIVEQSPSVLYRALAIEGTPRVYTSANVTRFGYTVEQSKQGRFRFPDFVHEDDRPAVIEHVRRMVEDGVDVFDCEYRMVNDAGEVFHILDRTTAIRNEAGQITHWQGVLTDVTQSRRAELALADATAALEAARLEARR